MDLPLPYRPAVDGDLRLKNDPPLALRADVMAMPGPPNCPQKFTTNQSPTISEVPA
jgi:hypothetical protein